MISWLKKNFYCRECHRHYRSQHTKRCTLSGKVKLRHCFMPPTNSSHKGNDRVSGVGGLPGG